MKTTVNFIQELLQRPIAESEITDLTFTMVGMLMKQYAEHVRDEDRKVIADSVNLLIGGGYSDEIENTYNGSNGDFVEVNKESIINAPKQELK